MKIFFLALLWAFPGYAVGLFGTLWLLPLISGNTHDGQMEAAMTGAFIFGPMLAILSFVGGILFLRSRKRTPR
jgi:glucose uptake protein GlcU